MPMQKDGIHYMAAKCLEHADGGLRLPICFSMKCSAKLQIYSQEKNIPPKILLMDLRSGLEMITFGIPCHRVARHTWFD